MLYNIFAAIVAAVLGFVVRHLWDHYRARIRETGQRAILAGIEDPVLFVFPGRQDLPEVILPRISTEDFLAINNIISAIISARLLVGWHGPIRVRDTQHLNARDREENNLVLICSPKTNEVTKEALELLRKAQRTQQAAQLIPQFVKDSATERWSIRWNQGTFPSESYTRLEELGRLDDSNTRPSPAGEAELNDVAVIVKARSPWAGQRKILVIAGIRGFGTWGAAECLKKWWKPLYDKKRSSKELGTSKDGDFVALVSVRYKEYDIKEARLLYLEDLDGK